ncbi:Uncharacterized protein OBRU01_18537 [Operophtera brumata]|uniref:KATNIP domain-containing protein n=1 Tax=Operophtera brumata TaxID=104452 RepID=A0A0L7KVR3_OPEBR|nr:Uncharacterized protein OBRU01_18537 [Operophtera brumata]
MAQGWQTVRMGLNTQTGTEQSHCGSKTLPRYLQSGRRKYRGNLDWGDSSKGTSYDFLTDLLPHYVTPRHKRLNNIVDKDFYDVILGPRPLEDKVRRKPNPKDVTNALQNNLLKPTVKNTTKKQASLVSVSNKSVKQDKVKSEFIIPELPIGRLLEIKVFSNWGDKQFVGLNGIEMFDSSGNVVDIEKIWTDCETGDGTAQGRVQNLADGVVRTRDERHAWTAPAPHAAPLALSALLATNTQLALLRIWNYNKSRIYSTRGVRLVQIKLDDQVIFYGEIARASGELKGPPSSFGDHFQALLKDNEPVSNASNETRPATANSTMHPLSPNKLLQDLDSENETKYVATTIKLTLMSNWGLELLCYNDPVKVYRAYAYKALISEDQGPSSSLIECKHLFNGRNISDEFEDMWCTEFDAGAEFCHIVLELKEPSEVTSIRIWNYNGSMELSYAGVRHARIHLDGEMLHYRPVLLRRAPGHVYYDYVHQLELATVDDR